MIACMHDYAKEHGVVQIHVLEPRVTTPYGKDYGFKCTYITGSIKFPNYNYPYEYIGV